MYLFISIRNLYNRRESIDFLFFFSSFIKATNRFRYALIYVASYFTAVLVYVLYTPFPFHVLLNHPLSGTPTTPMLFTARFSLILNLSLLRPRVSSQRYVENVEFVRELFLKKVVVEKVERYGRKMSNKFIVSLKL